MDFKLKSEKAYSYFWAIAFFGWSAILMVLAVLPSNELFQKGNKESWLRIDYMEHFLVFLFFALLFGLWRRKILSSKNREILLFMLFGGMYAAINETIQLFIASRTFNPFDLWFNLVGLLLGAAITRIYIF